MAFVVTSREVVKHVVPFSQVPPGQFLLDPILTLSNQSMAPYRSSSSASCRESSEAKVVVCQSRVVGSLEAGRNKR